MHAAYLKGYSIFIQAIHKQPATITPVTMTPITITAIPTQPPIPVTRVEDSRTSLLSIAGAILGLALVLLILINQGEGGREARSLAPSFSISAGASD